MPYDHSIADRIRPLLARRPGFAEKKMFGGLALLLHGNMSVGVWKEFLIARVGPDAYQAALARRGAHEFDITGRPMQGWVMVDPSGARDDLELANWVDQAVTFVESLPKKRTPKPKKTAKSALKKGASKKGASKRGASKKSATKKSATKKGPPPKRRAP